MAIEIPKDEPAAEIDDPPVYGGHKFTADEIARWRLVAEEADAFWLERGSDNSLDEEFKRRFGVTFFEHAYLSAIYETWTAKGRATSRKENA